jgi:hypothetical protein
MATRRNKRTLKRQTRKAATVEGLHASFEKIDSKVRSMVEKGKTDNDLACCIRKAWSEQFHMGLSEPAIKGMILHYRATMKRHTRKASGRGRSQKGGMAALDWTMGQGVTDHVYGRFPIEMGTSRQVLQSLDLGRFYENNGGRSCDTTGGHPAPGLAGKQAGGGFFSTVFNGHAPASIPHNAIETTVSTIQGAPIANPNPSPISAHVPLATYTPAAYNTGAISSVKALTSLYRPS